jgi:hypothetical protein
VLPPKFGRKNKEKQMRLQYCLIEGSDTTDKRGGKLNKELKKGALAGSFF